MNLGNEVIVKNFHVLSGAHIVTKVEKDGKVYFKITKSDGTTPDVENQRVTTDQFCLESIKRIRLTMPEAPKFKKWEITMPDIFVPANPNASPAVAGTDGVEVGTLLTVYMHYTNLFGFGLTDRLEKYATIVVKSGDTSSTLATRMAAMINNQYIKYKSPIEATATGSKVTITDATIEQQKPTLRRMEIGADPQPIQMYITTNLVTKKSKEGSHKDEDGWQWCSEVRAKLERTDSNGNQLPPLKYDGIIDTASDHQYKNDYLIWGLEKVSQLNSTDSMADPCTGFIGYDSVMDKVQLNTANYYVLDIAYETLPKMGVPSGRNLKELSFAALAGTNNAVPTVLLNILADLSASGVNAPLPKPTFARGSNHSVTLSTSVTGANIKFSKYNGTSWSEWADYESAQTLSNGDLLKAYVTKSGWADSEMIEVPYV